MEQNLRVIAKKFWSMVRVALFMMRKGISKSKLLGDLNMMMKRGKIARKAIHNLVFHHSHNWVSSAVSRHSHDGNNQNHHLAFTPQPDDYEFSCSNSPAYHTFHLPFHLNKRKNSHKRHQAPLMEDEFMSQDDVNKAIEMLQSAAASPALPGFGKSPMARQLRITDSPYPLKDVDDQDNHVDEAAEQFIKNFYKNLRRQSSRL